MPQELTAASPESLAIDPALGERLDEAVASGALPGLHGVAVLRHGHLALLRCYAGEDERWGTPLGRVAFAPETLHDLRSVSKSLVGLLYGIALEEGLVPPLGASLLECFPACVDLAADSRRRAMTLRHALTMTLGTAWDESLPYSDPRNSEIAMEMAPERCRFVLEQPMERDPGEAWAYCGGTTALLGRLIAQGSGRDLHGFARERLFAPLGIRDSEWITGSDGEAAAASGCRLAPADLARVGQMVLQQGRWGGRQVVPAAWLEQALAPQVACEEGLSYGFQWWLSDPRVGLRWVAAFGNGGQRLQLYPALDLVLVVLAGNYNRPDAWQLPVAVATRFLLPSLRGP